jgi:ABC-type polysaccharide/polyol phosphate transport system ATPase subunit
VIARNADPAVLVEDVTMEFLLVHERSLSFKEATIRALRGQRRHAERFRALDGVTFRVAPGEALGVIGPNGSGKTTLLRLLVGVLAPTGGCVRLAGRVTSLIELGAGFNPELSGEENVFLAGALYGIGRKEMRAKLPGIIEFAELERFAHVPVKNYSSGMSARLGFAVATDVDPEILVVDEVLAVGDASYQTKCFARMRRFRGDGKTIVLVSHDLSTVATFCDRALLLRDGRIAAEGMPADVISSYTGGARPA